MHGKTQKYVSMHLAMKDILIFNIFRTNCTTHGSQRMINDKNDKIIKTVVMLI